VSSDHSDSGLGHALAFHERFSITNFIGIATPRPCLQHRGWHLIKPLVNPNPSLSFPDEEQRLKQLRAKRDEYVQRIELCGKDDADLRIAVQSRHLVLDQLLQNGGVRFREAYKKVCELTGQHWPYDYASSWRVIEDYVETGGQYVAGGSLPSVSE
jgi:hypothetical protein